MYNETIILGIETSCDETGVSIYNNKKGILSEYTYTQTVHYKYGGIIPELASRNHEKKLLNLVILTLKKARIKLSDINIIAYTGNPGLSSSLLFGITFSKSLSYSLNIPSIEINHLEAHILISFLFNKKITFPSLVVLISGAHTILVEIKNYNTFLLLGKTLDDGVGEAFDKAARSLNIKPCNGLSIEKISKLKFNFENLKFPQPLSKSNCFNLSFSGLKTCVNKNIKKNMLNLNKSNIAYNFQNTIIKTLLRKCKLLLKKKKNQKYIILRWSSIY